LYNHLIFNENVCPEQAREILPMATYTEWVETGSLAAYARVFNQRSDSHAQYEINQYAAALGQLVPEEMAISWRALTDG
jgi:thymidylate synthase (FAD)